MTSVHSLVFVLLIALVLVHPINACTVDISSCELSCCRSTGCNCTQGNANEGDVCAFHQCVLSLMGADSSCQTHATFLRARTGDTSCKATLAYLQCGIVAYLAATNKVEDVIQTNCRGVLKCGPTCYQNALAAFTTSGCHAGSPTNASERTTWCTRALSQLEYECGATNHLSSCTTVLSAAAPGPSDKQDDKSERNQGMYLAFIVVGTLIGIGILVLVAVVVILYQRKDPQHTVPSSPVAPSRASRYDYEDSSSHIEPPSHDSQGTPHTIEISTPGARPRAERPPDIRTLLVDNDAPLVSDIADVDTLQETPATHLPNRRQFHVRTLSGGSRTSQSFGEFDGMNFSVGSINTAATPLTNRAQPPQDYSEYSGRVSDSDIDEFDEGSHVPEQPTVRSIIATPTHMSSRDIIRHIRNTAYRRGKKLGRGVDGDVFEMRFPNGYGVAVKEISVIGQPSNQVREAALVFKPFLTIAHPNLCRLYTITLDSERKCLQHWLELLSDSLDRIAKKRASAARRMHAKNSESGLDHSLPERTLAQWTAQIIEGLAHLHEHGIVHRDIKGANIMLASDKRTVKIIDFGSARIISGETATQEMISASATPVRPDLGRRTSPNTPTVRSGAATPHTQASGMEAAGTPLWMAPEIISTKTTPPTFANDVWSMGITVAELANEGVPPWPSSVFSNPWTLLLQLSSGEMKPTVPPGASEELADFLSLCWVHKPEERATLDDLKNHPWIVQHLRSQ